MQQISFTGNLEQQAIIFFITGEAKETESFTFFTRNCNSILISFFVLI